MSYITKVTRLTSMRKDQVTHTLSRPNPEAQKRRKFCLLCHFLSKLPPESPYYEGFHTAPNGPHGRIRKLILFVVTVQLLLPSMFRSVKTTALIYFILLIRLSLSLSLLVQLLLPFLLLLPLPLLLLQNFLLLNLSFFFLPVSRLSCH